MRSANQSVNGTGLFCAVLNGHAAKFLSFGWKQKDLRKSLSEDR